MKHILSILILVSLFSSCSEFMPGTGCFVVHEVREEKAQSTYQLVPTKGFGQTWIIANVGQYHIGDTVCIQSLR